MIGWLSGSNRGRVMALVAAALAVVLLANAHLVYVALDSQPDCVPHAKQTDGAGSFRAARSAC
jgi:hypothetical protein